MLSRLNIDLTSENLELMLVFRFHQHEPLVMLTFPFILYFLLLQLRADGENTDRSEAISMLQDFYQYLKGHIDRLEDENVSREQRKKYNKTYVTLMSLLLP